MAPSQILDLIQGLKPLPVTDSDLQRILLRDAVVSVGNRTGAIVQFGDKGNSPLYLLTNGHCIHLPKRDYHLGSNEVIRDQELERFPGDIVLRNGKRATTHRITYATITGTDLAILELNESADALKVLPAKLSGKGPKKGDRILIFPAPGFGERYAAKVTRIVPKLRESRWDWNNSIAFDYPAELPAGTSGSPIVSDKSWEIVGIFNTANEGGEPCRIGNPCEFGKGGVKTYKHQNYGQQIVQITTCVDSNGRINLNRAGCRLQ